MEELLVLEHPELPLHNPAELELGQSCCDVILAMVTKDGTQAWDTFMSLVATTRKLGISFF